MIFRENVKETSTMYCWKTTFRFRESFHTFTVIVSNNYRRISAKMSFTVEDKALIVINNRLINNRFFERG
jgi:hypothetical protein